jgi:dihydrolipoamide dehydrogenase
MSSYDVVVIGGGPGGYLAAERVAGAGKHTLLVEKEQLGGTCLNVGCIPTKSLLHSAKLYKHATNSAAHGVTAEGASYDWPAMQSWKDGAVKTLVTGVAAMERRLGVDVVHASASLVGPGHVAIGSDIHDTDHVIIATGSAPVMPAIPGAAGNPRVVDSTGILRLVDVPERLVIIGGGVIGVEFAGLFSMLGTTTTVIELLPEILPFADADVATAVREGMPQVDFQLGCRVLSIDEDKVAYERADGTGGTIPADVVLVAVGRRPLLEGWGATESGLDFSPAGVRVDDRMRTNLPQVWAVGDVTGRVLLAHAAYRMAEVAAANILEPHRAAAYGQVIRWDTVPWAVYGEPEAAGVGLTEGQARSRGLNVVTASVPGYMSGRFVAEQGVSTPGLAKVVADRDSGRLLGFQLVGPYASEYVWGAAVALESEFTVADLRQVVVPHPTVAELVREATWALKF